MSGRDLFSLERWWSVVRKEFLQLRRDRITFAMIVGIPIMQLTLFGYAINSDPKHLLTGVLVEDHSEFTRTFVAGMKASNYFDIVEELPDEAAARAALARGKLQFVLTVPPDFTRRLLRGERPALLLEADATDPSATGNAISAALQLPQSVAAKDLLGPLGSLAGGSPPFEVRLHALYNPEGITSYFIVPGLMGVILSMTLILMTGLAITRERERGTMENLLAMPITPLEVMSGKMVPYILIGLIQVTIILMAAAAMFHVPFQGNLVTFYCAALFFIAGNLAVGISLSSLAQNQLQAMQLTMFYFMPNILLSGFMFPFQGMPRWARAIGEVLPLTHFNRLVRGIMLKGNGWPDLWTDVWPIGLFIVVVMFVALRFYRRTLD
ncbi:MAG TPA: ABC transporter permease [Steroidobacteraceae bacterium]|nr:ABC transporter permease [Steroidobacteraceae bacterium]